MSMMTIADILRYEEQSRVSIGKKVITLEVSEPPFDGTARPIYEIPIREVNNPLKLCRWILHLSEKNWCDSGLINELIVKVGCHFKWRIRL